VTTGPDQRPPDRDQRGGASGGGGTPAGSGQAQGRRGKPKGAAGGAEPAKGQGGKGAQAGTGRAKQGAKGGQAGKGGPKQGAKGAQAGKGGPKQARGRHDPHRRDPSVETVAQLAGPLQKVLGRLPETQRRVLELRMGLADGHPHDLADTARELGLSLGEAREIEQRAFEHIREAIPLQQLQRFLPR
jgi:hypothetical protein